jgi:hypothetical protein
MGCNQSSAATSSTNAPVAVATSATSATSGAQKVDSKSPSKSANETVTLEGVEINFKPIHSAIRWKKTPEEVRLLLVSSAASNCRDNVNGNVPLHIASQNGHLELVQLLVEKAANVNLQNNKGNTALHMALSYDYIDVAKYLMSVGADKDILNGAGIPARRGLEGDKCLGSVMLGLADSREKILEAFLECEANLGDIDKASFIGTALKTKKNVNEIWGEDIQARFKSITSSL